MIQLTVYFSTSLKDDVIVLNLYNMCTVQLKMHNDHRRRQDTKSNIKKMKFQV